MKTNESLPRRQFIRTAAGAASLAAGLSQWPLSNLSAAEPSRASTEQRDKVLKELEAKGPQFLSVPPQDGKFLNLLVKATQSKRVLEVGTSHGYSTLWISSALEETGGKMDTIEILPERVDLAKKHVTQAGLSHRVTFHLGDAHEIVPQLAGPFDFVFLDADKEGELDYFKKIYPNKLPPGGMIAVHNAIRLRSAMENYLDTVSHHPDFDSVILSLTMQDGFSVSYRKRRPQV